MGLRTSPVVEALVLAAADEEPEVAEAARRACTIWRHDGVVGGNLLPRLAPKGQDRVRALGVKVRSPW
ncbi:hypothetical protein [Streptomyces sp. NPDC058279]|uniref:hypothetical protein n=1 Tax=Streptomyces sp. NPDC058279 TaxID=3346418 RepID=UPI0036F0ED32